MITALIFSVGCLAASPVDATSGDAGLEAYQRIARLTPSRDSAAQIKLALWCEAQGLEAERIKHLALAVMNDPANATARGLLGLVAYQGKWRRPDAVGRTVEADAVLQATLEQYNARRLSAPYTAEGQWKLALWCEENGLKGPARAHLAAVTELDPGREAAWKRLGYKKVGGRWATAEQLAAEAAQNQQQKQADRHWRPILERARDHLASKARRIEAEDELARIDDPRAVSSICRVFGGSEPHQRVAVRLLGQIDSPQASQALAALAIGGRSAVVRRAAAESLVRRDPRDFARDLAELLAKPIRYEVKPVGGPGSPGELFVEGQKFNLKRLYRPPTSPTLQTGDQLGVDASGRAVASRLLGFSQTPEMTPAQLRVYLGTPIYVPGDPARLSPLIARAGFSAGETQRLNGVVAGLAAMNRNNPSPIVDPLPAIRGGGRYVVRTPQVLQFDVAESTAEAEAAVVATERQLESDVAAIKAYNAPIEQLNERALTVLTRLTDSEIGTDPDAWKKWANDLLGYVYLPQRASEETPTITTEVPIAYQPQTTPVTGSGPSTVVRTSHSCFAGGTLVTTLAGSRSIESLSVGDQVLTQATSTGVLSYQPIVAVYHNPPNQTLRIELSGDESITATGIHRFWKAGKGWTMARELAPGDVLRTVGGQAKVLRVTSDQEQPVFNLQVAEGESFFVGRTAVLVHDNSLVQPVAAPFDAAPALETAAVGTR